MAMNPRLLRPTANDSPASIPGLALWLDAAAPDALYTTDAGPVTAVSSPLDISGCVGWWDADDDSTVSVDANNKVTAWADKSGSGYSMDQATESRRPLYLASGINGRKSIEFDIANGRQLIGAFTESLTAATVFVVNVVPDQASNAGRMLTMWPNDAVNNQDTTGSSSWIPLVRGTSNAFYSSLVAGPSYVAGYVVPQFGSQQILTSQHSGTAISQFYNGALYGTGSHTLNATFTHIGINTYTLLAFAGHSNQTTGEVIVFNTALSTSDRARVEAYLANKWGIANVHAPAVTASDPVGYWRDRSGNGRHATQSTAASRPVVGTQNGRKALTFVSKNMRGPATAFNGPVTAYWAGKTGQATSGAFVFADGSVNQTDAFHFGWENNEGPGGFGNGWSGGNSPRSRTVYGLGASWRSQPIIGGMHFSSAEGFATVNGARTTAGLAGELSQATAASFAIGSDLGSWTNLNGDIYELLIYSRALTTAERRKVEVYLARRWGITLAPQVANAEAQDWISRVYAAGSTVSQPVANAVSDFITGCQSDGIWDAMKSVVLLAGADTLAGALVPMKGTAPTSYNFASGDYNKTSGLQGNGSSTYLNSNRANDADPQDNSHNSVYVTQAQSTGIGGYLGSGDDTAVANRIIVNRTSGALLTKSRSASGASISDASNATGLIATQRSGSAGFSTIVNGTVTETTEASGSPGSANIVVFNRSLPFVNFTDGRLAFYSIGESLDLALLDARVSALMTAIGVS